MDDEHETYELWALAAFLRRRWPVVIATAALVAVTALVVSSLQSDRYEATATILFRDPGLDRGIFGAPILFGGRGLLGSENVTDSETAIALAELDGVAERTAERFGEGLDGDEVAERIEVREGDSDELLSITAAAPEAEESARLADAYARSFLEIREQADRDVHGRAAAIVTAELDRLGPELADSAEGARLRAQLDDLRAIELVQTGDAELVQAAEAPSERAAPKPLRATVLAGAAGLLLGLIAALLLDRLDRRLRTRHDFERAYGTRIVGTIPDLDAGAEADRELEAAWLRIRHPADGADPPRILLVLAARRGEGTSTVAAGLARAGAAAGRPVTLIEADAGERDAVSRRLEELPSGSDPVVVAGPPAAEAIPLLESCDGILIVAGAEQPAAVAEPLARELAERDAPVRGLVVNRSSGRLRPR